MSHFNVCTNKRISSFVVSYDILTLKADDARFCSKPLAFKIRLSSSSFDEQTDFVEIKISCSASELMTTSGLKPVIEKLIICGAPSTGEFISTSCILPNC